MTTLAAKTTNWVLAACVFGCESASEPFICPDADAGDLAITELRGAQAGEDPLGQWVELFNPTGRELDLRGLRISVFNAQGTRQLEARPITVRAAALPVEPGGYVTLGHHAPDAVPGFIDYSFYGDYHSASTRRERDDRIAPKDLPPAGRIELEACGVRIDEVRYAALPRRGTLALDGSRAPTAVANDDPTSFCVDDRVRELPDAPSSAPGTPQRANPPCD